MAGVIETQFFSTGLGELILGSHKNELCMCDWRYRKMRSAIDQRIQQGLGAEYIEEDSPVNEEAIRQLTQYFKGHRKIFDLPLLMVGSTFQKKVWNELLQVPFGKTETYLGLSRKLGDEQAIRAVATANGANAISIIIPCHRILGSDGNLTGYAGGLKAKKELLRLENAFRQGELDFPD